MTPRSSSSASSRAASWRTTTASGRTSSGPIPAGKLYVLQSRPVTGADSLWEECIEAAAQNPPDDDRILWTLRWAEAYWTGGISPLHFSVRVRHYRKSMEYMAEITGFTELKGQPYFRWHRGTVYYNCNFHNGLANGVIPSFVISARIDQVLRIS